VKRRLVYLLILLNSASFAQVTTGGGIVIPPYVITRPIFEKIYAKKVEAYLNHLKSREQICNSRKKIINSNDLMQVYLSLSLFELSNSENDKCVVKDKIFACINDAKTQAMFKAISNKKSFKNYLKSKYKINDSLSEEIIEFFSEMGLPEEK
jgi:hypothetical protein